MAAQPLSDAEGRWQERAKWPGNGIGYGGKGLAVPTTGSDPVSPALEVGHREVVLQKGSASRQRWSLPTQRDARNWSIRDSV